jgi:hypothetical protein
MFDRRLRRPLSAETATAVIPQNYNFTQLSSVLDVHVVRLDIDPPSCIQSRIDSHHNVETDCEKLTSVSDAGATP